jgi:hypothetical protein
LYLTEAGPECSLIIPDGHPNGFASNLQVIIPISAKSANSDYWKPHNIWSVGTDFVLVGELAENFAAGNIPFARSKNAFGVAGGIATAITSLKSVLDRLQRYVSDFDDYKFHYVMVC